MGSHGMGSRRLQSATRQIHYNVTGQIDHFMRLIDDGCIARSHPARKSNENLFGNPDGHGVPWKVLFLHLTPNLQGQFSTPADWGIEEEKGLTRLYALQEIQKVVKGLSGPRRLLEISRKAGDIPDETIISQNERSAREARFDGDEDVIAIDGKIVTTDLMG